MNELEQLHDELERVVEFAKEFSVNHTKVAEKAGIKYDYSRQIRNKEKPSVTRNNPESRKLVQKLIDCYRAEVRRKQQLLSSF